MAEKNSIEKIIDETKAYYCLQCGKCTSSCPISRIDEDYSPRLIVEKALLGHDEVLRDNELWSCLTCYSCDERCPQGVEYSEFIRGIREEAQKVGQSGTCSHGGIFPALMGIMTNPKIKQNRLDWVSDKLISKKGKILYFVGCLPYFDSIFKDIGVNALDIARGAVRIFNTLEIKPVVMDNERCCGHDLLWTGDQENFEVLAKLNLDLIEKTGAEKIITTCPECYRTLKLDYPEYIREPNFEVIHLSEFLADMIDKGKVEFNRIEERVTYHDPCRLGRHLGIYDPPRRVIENIPGIEFIEMEENRDNARCCGTTAWTNCSRFSKQLQIERLKDARATDATRLITTCPKCQIHLKCAMNDIPKKDRIEIEDLTTLVSKVIR